MDPSLSLKGDVCRYCLSVFGLYNGVGLGKILRVLGLVRISSRLIVL